MSSLNILIMGVAGSGKGTMSKLIEERFNIPHISTGDMFRKAMAQRTKLGVLAEEYINKGLLVPDDITIAMIKERLSQDDCQEGYLLDGFPRTLPQAKAFEEIANETGRPIKIVINLEIELSALAPRIVNRRLCKNCGAIYNTVTMPSKVEGICDRCQHPLVHRSDDTIEGLNVRIGEHQKLTAPVLDYFLKEGLVIKVDAGRPVEEVWFDIKKALENLNDHD
ncbi:MAG: adenylate kinase [Erysipelotrichaceae bacterium]|nr:adenylate kinase [Erysipelotrichaceae bacterium]MDD3924130.1 adenylate kinase [Erysipelotrichaceae bacterium]MDD4641935.1 adenylate kinase [Erysipelotrichaceae bacterium]